MNDVGAKNRRLMLQQNTVGDIVISQNNDYIDLNQSALVESQRTSKLCNYKDNNYKCHKQNCNLPLEDDSLPLASQQYQIITQNNKETEPDISYLGQNQSKIQDQNVTQLHNCIDLKLNDSKYSQQQREFIEQMHASNQISKYITPPPTLIRSQTHHPDLQSANQSVFKENNNSAFSKKKYKIQLSKSRLSVGLLKQQNLLVYGKLIKKFISQLQLKTRSYLFHHITQKQFQIISDNSSSYAYYVQKSLIIDDENNSNLFQKIFNSFIGIIKIVLESEQLIICQDSFINVLLELIQIFLNLCFIFIVPIIINFEHFLHFFPCLNFINWYLPIEMILNMNTAFYKRGIQMKKRGKIFQRYVQNDAILDIVIWIIFLLSQALDINQLQYIIVFKIFRLMNKIEELFLKYDRQVKHDIILHIFLLLLIIITFTHTQASIFVNLALTSSPDEENWINQTPEVKTNLDIYITSIYWSNITMTTIGYGDIYPRNNKERLFLAIITILSCCIFGYTMNSIGQILADTSKESRQFKIKMNLLVKQMSKRNLDQILQKRVRNYYEYLHDKKNIFDEESEKLIQDLPQSIRQEVIYDINMKLLNSHKIFQLQFSKQFQQDLSLCMKILKYGPEINIISQNDQVIQQLYFVLEGNLDINMKLESKSISLSVLKKGDMFGQIEFFSQKSSQYAVKTLNVVTIAYIEYQDFINALKNNPQDQEKYYLIKDKINQYKDISALDFQCQGCKRFGHQLFQCKSTNYDYKKNRVVQDYMSLSSNSTMERNQQFNRTRQKKQNQQKFTQREIVCQQQEFYSNNEDLIHKYYLTYKFLQSDNLQGVQDQTFQEIFGDLDNGYQQCAPNTLYELYNGSLQAIEEEQKEVCQKKARTTPPKTALKKNFIFLPPQESKKVSYSVLIQDKNDQNTPNGEVDSQIVGGDNGYKSQSSKKKIESPKVSFSAFPLLDFQNDQNERLNSTNVKINQATLFEKKEDSQLKQLLFTNNFILLADFEKSKIFKVYFPFNNIDLVLQNYKKYQTKKMVQNRKDSIKQAKPQGKYKYKTKID
ncbi:hypothetical protein ABPG74_000960 [Tetrahymena malaccensis]